MVSSSFTFYRDAFLFALAVRSDIDVAPFNLPRADGGAEDAHAGVQEHDLPDKYAMTKVNVRAVWKQVGASPWAADRAH